VKLGTAAVGAGSGVAADLGAASLTGDGFDSTGKDVCRTAGDGSRTATGEGLPLPSRLTNNSAGISPFMTATCHRIAPTTITSAIASIVRNAGDTPGLAMGLDGYPSDANTVSSPLERRGRESGFNETPFC
jgi:hypothetical protein